MRRRNASFTEVNAIWRQARDATTKAGKVRHPDTLNQWEEHVRWQARVGAEFKRRLELAGIRVEG